MSDCVLSAYSQIKQLKKPEAFAAWLFRILYCSCASQIKAQAARRQMTALNGPLPEPAMDMQSAIEKTELAEALAILTPEERDIVLLSVVSGLTSKEIAAVTDFTAGAVRSKLSRSLAKMRRFLEE